MSFELLWVTNRAVLWTHAHSSQTDGPQKTLLSARTVTRLITATIDMIAIVLAIMIAIAIVLVHVLEIKWQYVFILVLGIVQVIVTAIVICSLYNLFYSHSLSPGVLPGRGLGTIHAVTVHNTCPNNARKIGLVFIWIPSLRTWILNDDPLQGLPSTPMLPARSIEELNVLLRA